jgi:hypothetical protein
VNIAVKARPAASSTRAEPGKPAIAASLLRHGLAGGASGEFAVASSKPEPQVSYLRELLPKTTASQLRRVAVRRAPVRRHGPVCQVVSWLRTAAAGKTGGVR